MSELLAPAGNYEAFIAAINAGANAVYIGLNSFSARAYANNFAVEEIKSIVEYAHLRNVKVFVTMNTIIFQDELPQAYSTIDELAKANIDAIIIQDLALLDYVAKCYPSIEAHASTQMGIDDLEGINILDKLGVKRVVLAREVPIEKIKYFKTKTNMPLEAFIHGALCVSYSGNCLISGLIGMRSGNRGRCVGSCRKLYNLVNLTTNEVFPKNYLLSMKDLNTTYSVKDLSVIDSLKIEGRMKEPYYVYSVVNSYRKILDGDTNLKDINVNLTKTFNRTFTKGYLLRELPVNITNTKKPNNYGYYIGKVTNKKGSMIEIKLTETLNQGDQIRFDLDDINEVSLPIVKMYDKNNKLINSSNTYAYVECKERINIGSSVYKTKDKDFLTSLEQSMKNEYWSYPVNMYLNLEGNELSLTVYYDEYFGSSDKVVIEKANNNPTTLDSIKKQLSKLGNTPYYLDTLNVNFNEEWFIPVSILNNLRRAAILDLNKNRLKSKELKQNPYSFTKQIFPSISPIITASVKTKEQYDVCKSLGIKHIYYDNIIPRNNASYKEIDKEVLVGGLGGLEHYKNNDVITDYSFNVVNAESVNILHSLGANRVTLSHEINKQQIKNLVNEYYHKNGGYPNLEMIVYGRQEMLHTKYCPIKKMGECGKCKTEKFAVKDDFETFPILTDSDCSTTILNGKILNLIEEVSLLDHINYFRLAFTIESSEEIIQAFNNLKNKLDGKNVKCFNSKTDTRGHFNREIL